MHGCPTSRAQLSPRPPLRRLDGTHPRGAAPWCVCMFAAWASGTRLKSHPKAHSHVTLYSLVVALATVTCSSRRAAYLLATSGAAPILS